MADLLNAKGYSIASGSLPVWCWLAALCTQTGFAATQSPLLPPKPTHPAVHTLPPQPAAGLPDGILEYADDSYFEGYLQSLIDLYYYEYRVQVQVRRHHVLLAHMPKNPELQASIVSYVKTTPGVQSVEVVDALPADLGQLAATHVAVREAFRAERQGVWFPQTSELFSPIIADPREPKYTLSMRYFDHVMGSPAGTVSLGEDFAIYRWLDVGPWHGDLQFGIQAGIWSVFTYDADVVDGMEMAELMNTDYMACIPITYAINDWSWRFRLYHISSHLGDELMWNRPLCRVNPSFEAIDLFASWQYSVGLRLYGGVGWVLHSDESFTMDPPCGKRCTGGVPIYFEYGFEWRFWDRKLSKEGLWGAWFVATFWRSWETFNWRYDGTYLLGYEWSKLQGLGRKLRLYLQGHNGFSLEGQFMRCPTNYFAMVFEYGF
jgi:hypothetical protein